MSDDLAHLTPEQLDERISANWAARRDVVTGTGLTTKLEAEAVALYKARYPEPATPPPASSGPIAHFPERPAAPTPAAREGRSNEQLTASIWAKRKELESLPTGSPRRQTIEGDIIGLYKLRDGTEEIPSPLEALPPPASPEPALSKRVEENHGVWDQATVADLHAMAEREGLESGAIRELQNMLAGALEPVDFDAEPEWTIEELEENLREQWGGDYGRLMEAVDWLNSILPPSASRWLQEQRRGNHPVVVNVVARWAARQLTDATKGGPERMATFLRKKHGG